MAQNGQGMDAAILDDIINRLLEFRQEEDSPNSWEKMRDLCISVITSYSPMILCTQQGVKSQLEYLQQGLPGNVSYNFVIAYQNING
ncbi:Serine/threonine-protein phosphatase PP1 isozyme 2 [Camellia lanceoleosa]|uniref:Serine/threonine-protein phosphatase PP1 isozyme 2 n=1 Tax=Camellia lanceoleosa TaxID=1840588 RepID=A0ACC0HG01_9ERIC|nr:Serine/threonine-protein phosphatase PP1 isozyme 2 [Camellia lanceoleosa]